MLVIRTRPDATDLRSVCVCLQVSSRQVSTFSPPPPYMIFQKLPYSVFYANILQIWPNIFIWLDGLIYVIIVIYNWKKL